MSFQSFEELEVWKRACQQAVGILDMVDNFTNYSLKDQMTRCSISVPSNIAEGHGRNSTKDFIRFLNYSQGSNGELRTQLYICGKKQLISKDSFDTILNENLEISNMLEGLRSSQQRLLSIN
jgi:four helix bundle protein